MTPDAYGQQIAATRADRMRWCHAARFGMFVHWGLYSQLGRHEWVMNRERIPIPEYEKLAPTWRPGPTPAREWARLAKQAYMVGDGYTLVDMSVWGWARVVPYALGADAWEKLPNVKRLLDEINARPAAQRVEALKTRYAFKSEMDDEAKKAMVPSNARLAA